MTPRLCAKGTCGRCRHDHDHITDLEHTLATVRRDYHRLQDAFVTVELLAEALAAPTTTRTLPGGASVVLSMTLPKAATRLGATS